MQKNYYMKDYQAIRKNKGAKVFPPLSSFLSPGGSFWLQGNRHVQGKAWGDKKGTGPWKKGASIFYRKRRNQHILHESDGGYER